MRKIIKQLANFVLIKTNRTSLTKNEYARLGKLVKDHKLSDIVEVLIYLNNTPEDYASVGRLQQLVALESKKVSWDLETVVKNRQELENEIEEVFKELYEF